MTSELIVMLNVTSTIKTTESFANNSQGRNDENYERPFNQIDVVLFAAFVVIFMVFGFFANLFTAVVIATSKKLRSIFHFFIFSLCVSDATSALVSWINFYRRTWGFDDFMLPDFLCKLYWALDLWTSYSTALHILSFSILRWAMFQWPTHVNSTTSGYPAGLVWILLIWIITFACGAVPFGVMFGVSPKNRTSDEPSAKWPFCTSLPEWDDDFPIYSKLAYPIFFYIPILVTVFFSVSIVCLMLRSRGKMKSHMSRISVKNRNTKERQAVFQLALIVTSFIIGYVPFTAYEFFTVQQRNDTYENRWIDWHFGTVQYMCLRLSECLNPVFYHIGSRTLRKETKKFIYKIRLCFLSHKSIPPNFSNAVTRMSIATSFRR